MFTWKGEHLLKNEQTLNLKTAPSIRFNDIKKNLSIV